MPHPTPPATERLRNNPSFVQTSTLDGRPYIAKETEPYTQFWLTERERQLLGLFGQRRGATAAQALAGYCRLTGCDPARAAPRVAKAVAGMLAAGALMRLDDDTSRYSAPIVQAYVAHRPIPPEVSGLIARLGAIGPASRVLDLAGGPGDLALALARHSTAVAMMELSRGFITAARRRARAQGLALQTLHDSCNRLVYRDERYDVVSVSQALHWLDDVMVCRGLCRVLAPGGHFFVVHSAIVLDDHHPLAYLLGHDSVLGAKPRQGFAAELQPLQRRLCLLFQALDAPEVQRIDPTQQWAGTALPIGPAGVSLLRQQRPIGLGYARGFLTPQHIARLCQQTGQTADAFWADLAARCSASSPAQRLGTHHWAVLHFQRGAALDLAPLLAAARPQDIGYGGPAD